MLKDFKAFIMRGNVLDLAVAVVIGGAFGAIVKSLVDDIVMPPIGLALGKVDFSNLFVVLKEGTKSPPPYATPAAAKDAGAVTLNYGAFINSIVNFILTPTWKVLPPGSRMIYTQPGEAFGLYIQISLIMGVVLAAPWILYQVWLFIAPGLYANEKRLAIPFVAFGTIGFIAGTLVNHYITFPFMMKFFASFIMNGNVM